MPEASTSLSTESRQKTNRLVLVTTSAWLLAARDAQLLGIRYQPHDTQAKAEAHPTTAATDLLSRLLDPTRPGSASAWRVRLDEVTAETSAVFAPPDTLPVGDVLTAAVGAELAAVARGTSKPVTYRVVLDAQRFLAVTKRPSPGPSFWVLIDLHFSLLLNQLRCHAAVSVWNSPPQNPRLVRVPPPPTGGLTESIPTYRDAFQSIADATEGILAEHLHPVHLHVFERDYALPTFWVVAPFLPPADPLAYLDQCDEDDTKWLEWTGSRAKELLGTADALDHRLNRGVLNTSFLVLRRVTRTETSNGVSSDRNVPTYLILPGGPALQRESLPETGRVASITQRREDVELAAAGLIIDLANLEAQAANLLHLHQRDLEIWNNHLKVYNAVVERGSFLWDAISTHLMIRWGAPFERAHNAVDLIHQVLQQAVADLREIATLTHQAMARVGEAAERLQNNYDLRIGEHTRTEDPGLRAALTVTGVFGRVVRTGNQTAALAEQVKTAYDDQLQAIAGAFDERRVRELDGTQKASFFVGFFAALIGLVTVMDAAINMKPNSDKVMTSIGGPHWLAPAATDLSIGLGVLVFVLSMFLVFQVTGIGKLGTKDFRHLYHGTAPRWFTRWRPWRRTRWTLPKTNGLWRFLKDTSTDHQKHLMQAWQDTNWDARWNAHDVRCAEQLAAIWDAAQDLPGCERHDKYTKDIQGLSRMIEQWGVHSLLLTERARVMHWFDLPNLTCLYRCCTLIDKGFPRLSDLGDTQEPPVNMVAGIDLTLALMRLGFTRQQSKEIDHWLLSHEISTTSGNQPGYKSAAQAWDRVRDLKLHVGMSAEERDATLDVIATAP